MNPVRSILLLLTLFLHIAVVAQNDALYNKLGKLKKKIRQSTYYDSAAVFSNGASAIKLARELKAPGEEGLIYQYYGNFYFYSNDYPSAIKYYNKAIGIATKSGDLKLKNATQIRLAFILVDEDLIKSEAEFRRLLTEAKKHGFIENTIEAYTGFGCLSDRRQIFDKSFEYYYKALRLAEKHKKYYYVALMLNNIALLKQQNNQPEEARVDLLRGLKLAEMLSEYRLMSNIQNNLGIISSDLADYSASINHYKATVRIAKKMGFPKAIGVSYMNLSNTYMLDRQLGTAAVYVDSAITVFSDFQDLEFLGRSYVLKGLIAAEDNNTRLAWKCVDSILKYNQLQASPFNYINSFDVRSLIYEKEKNFEKALDYRSRFYRMNDSLNAISNRARIADLQVLYGRERVVAKLVQEKTKNKLLAKEGELETAKWRMVLTVSLGIFLLILGIAYIRYIVNKRRQQIVFSQKLIKQLDEERSRISKDLHDDIGQLLSIVKSKINMYTTGRLSEISSLEKEVGEVIDHTRSISHQLHPSLLEKLGLARALCALTERTQNSTGIICSMDFEIPIDRLELDTQTQLYRICQECINNTIKHACASALKMTFEEVNGWIVLNYRDNGIGISNQTSKEGLGFMTIRERVNKINGKLLFSSGVQKGMQLTVRFK